MSKLRGFFTVQNTNGYVFADPSGLIVLRGRYDGKRRVMDSKIYPFVFASFEPFKRLHYAIFHQLRCAKRPWSDLNKAVKITYPCSNSNRPEYNENDDYDETTEYPKIEIEFAEQERRFLKKSDYCVDYILYEVSTNFVDYTHKYIEYNGKKKVCWFPKKAIRHWCGIKFEGDSGNLCISSKTDDIHLDEIHDYIFSGEFEIPS
jgi:hypothetical protein